MIMTIINAVRMPAYWNKGGLEYNRPYKKCKKVVAYDL